MNQKYLKKQIHVNNYLTGKSWTLSPLDNLDSISPKDLEEIVRICNETEIYNILFKDKLLSKEYTHKDARSFVKWASLGWKHNKYFVFIVRDDHEKISAAIDIKSDNLEGVEIGYWASKKRSGVMTNAISELIASAHEVGFKSFYAIVREDNFKSASLLRRLGFEKEGILPDNKIKFQKNFV